MACWLFLPSACLSASVPIYQPPVWVVLWLVLFSVLWLLVVVRCWVLSASVPMVGLLVVYQCQGPVWVWLVLVLLSACCLCCGWSASCRLDVCRWCPCWWSLSVWLVLVSVLLGVPRHYQPPVWVRFCW